MTGYTKFTTTLLMGLLINTSCYSIQANFPRGCEVTGYGFSQNDLVLNDTNKQVFFLIKNRSNYTIELKHVETRPNVFMSPSLATQLKPLRWSAFAADESNLYFRCFRKAGDENLEVNCRDALDICQYPRVKFALSNRGTYWVSTDKPQAQVIKESTKKGIFLHW